MATSATSLITGRDTTRCVFCGHPETNHEHVISRGLHTALPPREQGRIRTDVRIEFAGRIDPPYRDFLRGGQVRDWQIKCVCRDNCNNGWMRRRVDEPARPVLRRLIQGAAERLYPADLRAVAAWAVLKAMVATHSAVDPADLAYMYAHHRPPPDRWAVWIGNYDRQNWPCEYACGLFAVLDNDEFWRDPEAEVNVFNSGVVTLVLGKLFIQVMYCPVASYVESWAYAHKDGAPVRGLVRIYPAGGDISVSWPVGTMTDRDADDATDGVIHDFRSRAAAFRAERGLKPLMWPHGAPAGG